MHVTGEVQIEHRLDFCSSLCGHWSDSWEGVMLPMYIAKIVLAIAVFQSNFAFGVPDWTCADGTSINSNFFCDGFIGCSDGSDEIQGNASCPLCLYPSIACTVSPFNKTCLLHRDYICNGTVTCQGVTPCDVGCPSHYRCQNSSKCVPRSTVCDGKKCNGCPEDDDWQNGVGFKCVRSGRICRLPQQLLWDSVQDCDDGSDLCYSLNNGIPDGRDLRNMPGVIFDSQKCSRCLDNSAIVPSRSVCDGIVDCPDLSDECLCSKRPDICNHVTLQPHSATQPCAPGEIRCGNGSNTRCVKRTSVCDGVADCPDNLDEKFSYCGGTLSCPDGLPSDAGNECRCGFAPCPQSSISGLGAVSGVLCDGVEDCKLSKVWSLSNVDWTIPPGFPQDECEAKCPEVPGEFNCTVPDFHGTGPSLFIFQCAQSIIPRELVCNGIIDCADKSDESHCPNRFLCKSGFAVSISRSKVCDGYQDCDDESDENPTSCPGRFYCSYANGRKVSVSKKDVCDFYANCDNAEDERNCTQDGRFYCENGVPLFVRKSQVKNGRGDCSDWSDEYSSKLGSREENETSQLQFVADIFLRAIKWLFLQ